MQAMNYAERLACESKWSHATYRYLKAAFIIQFMDDEARTGNSGGGQIATASADVPIDLDGGSMAAHVTQLLE